MQQLPRSHSFKPATVSREDIPALRGESESSVDRKLLEIRAGGELLSGTAPLPESRLYQNVLWVPFFALVSGAVLTLSYVYAGDIVTASTDALPDDVGPASVTSAQVWTCVGGGVLGAVMSVIVAFIFLQLTHRHPASVVYVSLYLSPALSVVAGIVVMISGVGELWIFLSGAFLTIIGLLSLVMVTCCYQHLIPFMIEVMHMISGVIIKNPAMLFVSFGLSVCNLVWTALCGLGFGGAIIHHERRLQDDESSNDAIFYAVILLSLLVFIWGAQVIYNVCHVTYCGVFARWYYQRPATEGPVRKSLVVALTTSFGSICFGSFVVSLVRVMEVAVKSARREAQQEGNYVTCVLLCLLECFIACIGDMLEYFNEWAYVQCAIRGVGFIEGVRITFAMLTCANAQFVLQDLLLNSVINLGALLCGVVGSLSAFVLGLFLSDLPTASGCAAVGLMGALVAGGTAFSVIGSGVKTILVCWVDNPGQLKLSNDAMDEQFEQRINTGYEQQMGIMHGHEQQMAEGRR